MISKDMKLAALEDMASKETPESETEVKIVICPKCGHKMDMADSEKDNMEEED